MARSRENREDRDRFDQRVVEIKRVTRVVAGGKRMRFRALVVVGDKRGSVGMSVKKGADVAEAVNKAAAAAKKEMVKIKLVDGTIPHRVEAKFKSSSVILKPAPTGSGVIAGGAIRPVVEAAGISNIVAKILGSPNKVNNIKAVLVALSRLKEPKRRPKAKDNSKGE